VSRWKLPARRFLYAAVGSGTGFQDAALAPRRNRGEWTGWLSPGDLAHGSSDGVVEALGPAPVDVETSDRAAFAHVLAINPAARQRFNVAPIARPASGPLRAMFDARDWDRSQVMIAPGESGSPASAHYADLAAAWSKGEMVPLLFSDDAVNRNAAETLTLVPPNPKSRIPNPD